MQAERHDGKPMPIEIYDQDEIVRHLDNPDIKEVRVFKLQLGMEIRIKGNQYKVTRMLPNGRAQLTLVQHREEES